MFNKENSCNLSFALINICSKVPVFFPSWRLLRRFHNAQTVIEKKAKSLFFAKNYIPIGQWTMMLALNCCDSIMGTFAKNHQVSGMNGEHGQHPFYDSGRPYRHHWWQFFAYSLPSAGDRNNIIIGVPRSNHKERDKFKDNVIKKTIWVKKKSTFAWWLLTRIIIKIDLSQ